MSANNKGHPNLTPNAYRNTPGIRYNKDSASREKYKISGLIFISEAQPIFKAVALKIAN